MLKKRYSSLLIFIFFLLSGFDAFSKENKVPDPFLTKVYRMLCHEEYDDAADELRKEIKANPKNVPAHLTLLFEKKQQDLIAARMAEALASDPDMAKLSEVDRIIFAAHMIGSRSVDFEKMQRLLNFKSSDVIVESYRKVYEGSLDILNSRVDDGVLKLAEAVDELPTYDPVVLSQLLSYSVQSQQHAEIAASYEHVSKAFEDEDPAKFGLKAFAKVADGDERKLQEIANNVQEAYEMCPYDPGFAMDHANFLFQKDQKNEARDVLLESIARHTFYPPYMDLLLAEIYDAASDHKKRDFYFARAKAALPYFDAETRKHVTDLEPTHSTIDLKTFAVYGTLSILIVALIGYFQFKPKKFDN